MACGNIILAPCISAACLSHAVDTPCRPFKGLLFASYVHHADPLASLHRILASLHFLHYFSCPIRADLLPVENYRAKVKVLILSFLFRSPAIQQLESLEYEFFPTQYSTFHNSLFNHRSNTVLQNESFSWSILEHVAA